MVRAIDTASEATYKDVGADDEMSFTIGKMLGLQLMVTHLAWTSFTELTIAAEGTQGLFQRRRCQRAYRQALQ